MLRDRSVFILSSPGGASVDALRGAARQVSRLDDEPEQVDRVGIRCGDGDVLADGNRAGGGYAVDLDVDIRRREAPETRRADGDRARNVRVVRDHRLPRRGANGIGEAQVVVEGDTKLDDREKDEEE